jgi:cation transport ATPase
MKKHALFARIHLMLAASFILSVIVLFGGGLISKESETIVNLIITLSVTMAGFGLVAFQIAHASSELKDDFLECSIFMIISTILGFFYLIYPDKNLIGFNFGEASMFMFFWGFILFLVVLIDKRLNILK